MVTNKPIYREDGYKKNRIKFNVTLSEVNKSGLKNYRFADWGKSCQLSASAIRCQRNSSRDGPGVPYFSIVVDVAVSFVCNIVTAIQSFYQQDLKLVINKDIWVDLLICTTVTKSIFD